MDINLECTGCGATVASFNEEIHIRLSAMQAHDSECPSHSLEGCTHAGFCYESVG